MALKPESNRTNISMRIVRSAVTIFHLHSGSKVLESVVDKRFSVKVYFPRLSQCASEANDA
jgi:hypothetical protein